MVNFSFKFAYMPKTIYANCFRQTSFAKRIDLVLHLILSGSNFKIYKKERRKFTINYLN